MARWLSAPNDPLFEQPQQIAFLRDRRRRYCLTCRQEYLVDPPEVLVCPICRQPGRRVYDRMVIVASRRWGKTRIGSIASVDEACIPNTIGWACAPSAPKLHRYIIPAFQKLIPDDWVLSWSSELLDLRLKNGSLIHFQTLEDPDQGRGQGLNWLWIDEACELTKTHWDVIRPSLAGDNVAIFTTTPRGHDWVYRDLYRPAEDGVPGYWACRAKASESANPQLSPEFLARERLQMSDIMYRREYEADFVTFEGSVYGDLIAAQILRTAEDHRRIIPEWPSIDPSRPIIIGIDTGADHPFGALKLLVTDAGLVTVGEYLERDRAFIQHAAELKRLAGQHPVRWAINKNERQAIHELVMHGITAQRAENDQLAGIERIKAWLHRRELWFSEILTPKAIRQLQGLRYLEPREDGQYRDRVLIYKQDDELPDCLRYAVMIATPPQPAPPPPAVRSIDGLPPEARWTVERMRRIAQQDADHQRDVADDFWA